MYDKHENASQNAQETAEGGQAPKTPPPAPKAALLKWHAQKKTKRDLLAIAVTGRCLDYAQDENTLDETELTEAEFDLLMKEAAAVVEKARKEAGRAAKILVHPNLLIAVIVRRPNQAICDKMIAVLRDPDINDDETQAILRTHFTDLVVWPKPGSEPMATIMENAPIAFGNTFPGQLLAVLGKDNVSSKKAG